MTAWIAAVAPRPSDEILVADPCSTGVGHGGVTMAVASLQEAEDTAVGFVLVLGWTPGVRVVGHPPSVTTPAVLANLV